jgi:hypothetical protein
MEVKLSALSWIYYTSTNAGASWVSNSEPQKGSSIIGPWNFVTSSADGTKLVATSAGSSIWTSTNSGASWTSNNVSGVNGWNWVASSADGNKLVAATGDSGGFIYTSTNSGITWFATSAPFAQWNCVASSADGTRLAATAWRGIPIYISTNSGVTWEQANTPVSNLWSRVALSADGNKLVAGSDPNLIFDGNDFLGSYGGYIYTSTDFGKTWITNDVPKASWSAIASSADGTKLVGGQNTGAIYVSTDSGTTWTSNESPDAVWISIASSADGNKMIAAGVFPNSLYFLQTTPSPQLNLISADSNLAFSWTVPSTNFVLQQSLDLANWTTLTNSPSLNFTNLQEAVSLSPSNGSSFFRLIAQ